MQDKKADIIKFLHDRLIQCKHKVIISYLSPLSAEVRHLGPAVFCLLSTAEVKRVKLL